MPSGLHEDDINQVTAWLTKQGFTVENVTKSKRVIQLSGTSGQVEQAFPDLDALLRGEGRDPRLRQRARFLYPRRWLR